MKTIKIDGKEFSLFEIKTNKDILEYEQSSELISTLLQNNKQYEKISGIILDLEKEKEELEFNLNSLEFEESFKINRLSEKKLTIKEKELELEKNLKENKLVQDLKKSIYEKSKEIKLLKSKLDTISYQDRNIREVLHYLGRID